MYPVQFELPPSVKGQGPTLATLVEVAHILEKARHGPPISLAEIGRRMAAKQVRHATIKASVEFLQQMGYVVQGSKGVLWTYNPDARLWQDTVRFPED